MEDKITNNATLISLANDLNIILRSNGLRELSQKALKDKTVDELIELVNDRLKSNYEEFFNKELSNSIFDLIENVEVKDGKIIDQQLLKEGNYEQFKRKIY